MDVLGAHTAAGSESSALAAELLSILGGLELESLIQAHDQAAALLDPACFTRGKRHKVRMTYLLFNIKSIYLAINIYFDIYVIKRTFFGI